MPGHIEFGQDGCGDRAVKAIHRQRYGV